MAAKTPAASIQATDGNQGQGGRKRLTVSWSLANGDTIAPYVVPVWAALVNWQFIPGTTGAGQFSQSYEDPTAAAPNNLVLVGSSLVATTLGTLTSPPNWISGVCTAGSTNSTFIAVFESAN